MSELLETIFISVVANEVEKFSETLFLVHNGRSEVTSCSMMLSIKHKFEQGFPKAFRLGGGGEGGLEEYGGWIQPKVILRYFETILRQNLLFSVAVHFNV